MAPSALFANSLTSHVAHPMSSAKNSSAPSLLRLDESQPQSATRTREVVGLSHLGLALLPTADARQTCRQRNGSPCHTLRQMQWTLARRRSSLPYQRANSQHALAYFDSS